MARPSFPFYPDDWMNDLGLRGCPPAARGVWADMLCLMHQGEPYGYLTDKAGPLSMRFVANRCGITIPQLLKALSDLENHHVFSRDEGQVIFSRRMIRDEHRRILRAAGGPQSLLNLSVPRKKGILPSAPREVAEGILPSAPIVPPFGSEEEEVYIPVVVINAEKPSWEEINEAWKWYVSSYPGEVNTFIETRLFLSVMETREDLADLRKNLTLWKLTKKWQDGYFKESKNFLSERMFKITPKPRDSPAPQGRTTALDNLIQKKSG